MSFSHILLLGALSGLTIFLGLPLARFRSCVPFLNALGIGVLFFLLTDIVHHAMEPAEDVMMGGEGSAAVLIGILAFGFIVGLLSLVFYSNESKRKKGDVSPQDIALMIAVGIGLHNFSEGLAIGNSAVQGDIHLAFLLIVGFGLHNITEAFCIASPLVGTKSSWKFLLLAGCIAGLPNFAGTLIGSLTTSEVLAVFFLALAAGAIVYVISELSCGKKMTMQTASGLAAGFLLAFATDLLLIFAGA